MPVKAHINYNWSREVEGKLKVALLEMVTDIHRRSITLAPVDTRALVNSARILPVVSGYKVTFGSAQVPYARIQHEGGVIKPKKAKILSWVGKDGVRRFAKSVTIKPTKYLAKAGDSVVRGNVGKYFRGKV